jgi:hypothetical protein
VGFAEYDALIEAKEKIGRAIIGTHFYQTAPDFIETFSTNLRVRFIMDHSAVFHPKLYLFEHGRRGWACIVGSANFTAGGFGRNQEACVLVTNGDVSADAFIANARVLIKRYWDDAVPGSEINLARYREMQKRFAKPLAHAGGHFGDGRPGRVIEEVDILNMSWDEFLKIIRANNDDALGKRLTVLGAARNLFRDHEPFESMKTLDRQGIAGFREDDGIPWAWFGSMRGAGVFKKIVN